MSSTNTFGSHIKTLRTARNIGQRELARAIGISPSYLNDIENNKRAAPSKEIIKKFAAILEANLENLYDLAGKSKNNIPPDIPDIIKKNKEIPSLIRTIERYDLSSTEIKKLKINIEESNMKAIIIAAGMGNRMRPYTVDLPKCMLKFGGKTLFQRQQEALNACKVKNIVLVKGYKKEKIKYPGIKYYVNDNYQNNNILDSLFYAEKEIEGEVIVSYSDILFEKQVVERLLESKKDISIIVDIKWQEYYEDRKDHPIEEAENVIFDAENNVVEIGKILTKKHDVHGEFIGMIKLTARGSEIFKRHYNRSKKLFWGKPFQRAATFEKAYLTDMIQEMVDLGVPIHCVIIERGWKEIDTVEDYKKALKEFED
ncbi:MAG: helix-turn-helix domain-containing protein [Candidatus Aminicenantaceae bacterium]